MNIKLDIKLQDLEGNSLGEQKDCVILNEKKEIVHENGAPKLISMPTGEVLTAKKLCIDGLLGGQLENLDGNGKYERWVLAKKIKDSNGSTSLTAEEIVSLKDIIGKSYNPLIVGQIYDILENKS